MKKVLLLALAASAALSGAAQSKINPAGRLLIQEFAEKTAAHGDLLRVNSDDSEVSAIVLLKEGFDASVLNGFDLQVLSDMEGVVVISCRISEIDAIAQLDEVLQIGFGEQLKANLDFARLSGNVNSVQDGFTYDGQTLKYDGTGVVCGMMDTGLEANHINFKNSDGTSRIQRLWHMTSSNGKSTMYTAANVSSFTTDTQNDTHATHVAGIMAGGYKGNGNYLQLTTASGSAGSQRVNQPIPFYGVATGADLALNCGMLYTPNVIQGVTNVIEYAESTGQPCVVNLSLGSNIGPHDGSDYFTASLSRLGKRGIICISAGNEGEDALSVAKTLGASGNNRYLRTFPNSQTIKSAVADLWTSSSKPVPAGWYIRQGTEYIPVAVLDAAGAVTTANNETFRQYFNGTIKVTASVGSNNRYNVYSEISSVSPKSTSTTAMLCFSAGGDNFDGETLLLVGNGVTFSNRPSASSTAVMGFSSGSATNSINNNACGENLLSVGAYTTRTSWGAYPNSVYQYTGGGFSVGDISPFSSYGATFQGTQLPLVCAPGAAVVSSMSRFYVAAAGVTSQMTANATNGTVKDYWGASQGTSMSCPYVAGTVALWLQANPSLTFDDVMDVINNTSDYNNVLMKGGRWGAGKINALEGVKYVLEHYSAIGSVWDDDEARLLVTPNGGGYDVTLAGEGAFDVEVYDLQGRSVISVRGTDGAASVSTSGLNSGIYVLSVKSPSFTSSKKISVR